MEDNILRDKEMQGNAGNSMPSSAQKIPYAAQQDSDAAAAWRPSWQQQAAQQQQQQQAAPQQAAPKRISMSELVEKLQGVDKEEDERERKKEKRRKLYSAISDGISALSNLYFTTRYAPSAFDASMSQSKQAEDWADKMRKERGAKKRDYVNAAINVSVQDNANEIADYRYEQAQERQKRLDEDARKRAEKEAQDAAEERKWKHDLADRAYDFSREKFDETKRNNKEKRENERERIALTRSRITYSRQKGKYIAEDADGNAHEFGTAKQAEWFAKNQGTWQDDYADTERTTDQFGVKTTTTNKVRAGGHPKIVGKKKPSPSGKKKDPSN